MHTHTHAHTQTRIRTYIAVNFVSDFVCEYSRLFFHVVLMFGKITDMMQSSWGVSLVQSGAGGCEAAS